MHTGLMGQRLLGQVPLLAALPNFVTEFLQGRLVRTPQDSILEHNSV